MYYLASILGYSRYRHGGHKFFGKGSILCGRIIEAFSLISLHFPVQA